MTTCFNPIPLRIDGNYSVPSLELAEILEPTLRQYHLSRHIRDVQIYYSLSSIRCVLTLFLLITGFNKSLFYPDTMLTDIRRCEKG